MPNSSSFSIFGPQPAGGAAGSISGSYYPSINPNGQVSAANSTISSAYKINTALSADGNCDISGDLTVDGVSIRDQLAKINERLAILVPDPELLAKYEALRNAYQEYKTLEALCK